MAKFCMKCGNSLNGGEKFCNKCGTAVENQVDVSNANTQTVETTSDTPEVDTQVLRKQSRKFTLGVVAAFAVVIAIIIAIANSGKPYEEPLENFAEGINNCDYKTFCKAVNPEESKPGYDYNVRDFYDQLVSETKGNGSLEFKVKESKKIEDEEDAETMELIVDGGFEENKITNMKITVVKIRDHWYLADYRMDLY